MTEEAAVPPQNEDTRVYLSDEGAAALVFLLGSQLDEGQRSQILVGKNLSGEDEIKFSALTEIIEALEAKQGNTITTLFESDDARQEAFAQAHQVSRSQQFFIDGNEVKKDSAGFVDILEENQARLVMQWMGWNQNNYSYLNEYKQNILDQEIKKAEKKFTIVAPEQVDLNSSIEDQVVSRRPTLLQSILRIGQKNTTKDAAPPQLQDDDNESPEAAASMSPAAPPQQPVSVDASMSPVASAKATANVISFEQIPYIKNPFKKTYMADRIENVGWFVHRAAGLVALGAVAAVAIAPFAIGLTMGAALTWGVGATFATYGLGFGLNQLSDIIKGFESPKVKQQRDNAALFDILAADERQSVIKQIYAPAIRGQIIEGLSPELQAQLARQAEQPAPVVAAPEPVVAAPEPVVAAPEPVAVAAPPEREPAAEQPVPAAPPESEAPPAAAPAPAVAEQTAPVAVAQTAAEQPERETAAPPAPAAKQTETVVAEQTVAEPPVPVLVVNFGLGDNTPYELYRIDTANDINFANSSINTQFNGAEVVLDVALEFTYKSSFTDADLVRLGFSQQR